MIKRYSIRELDIIFSDKEKYKNWLRIEESVLKYFCSKGLLDASELKIAISEALIIPGKIRELEKVTKHDVVAFVNHISSLLPQKVSKWIHYGMTSSDLVDTANSLALQQANQLILRKAYKLLSRLRRLSHLHEFTYCLYRESSLEPKGLITFGSELGEFYEDIDEAISSFEQHRKHVECASISGSMGIFSHIDIELQDFVARDLDLYSAPCSTQVLSRDRYARYFAILNRIVQSIHKLSQMIRLRARTEVGELWESFHFGQIGSSSMPHKRNPVNLENVCGLCRLFDSYVRAASQNTNIWLERDISHSSVDRVVFLDAITLSVKVISQMEKILHGLYVNESKMFRNIKDHEYMIYKPKMINFLTKELKDVLTKEDIVRSLDEIYADSISGRISFRSSFESTDISERLGEKKVKKLFELHNYVLHSKDFLNKLFYRDNVRRYFSTIFYEKEAILNAIDNIALILNNKYAKLEKPVKLLAMRESSLVFMSQLLTKLNFPVELKTVDSSEAVSAAKRGKSVSYRMFGVLPEDVKGRDVIVLDGLINNVQFSQELRKSVSQYRSKSVFVVSLFSDHDKSICQSLDLYGLLLPTTEGVAGFGIDNKEGLFRNFPVIGKLTPDFLPDRARE